MENRIDQPDKATTCVALAGPGAKCMVMSPRGTIVVVTVQRDGTLCTEMTPAAPPPPPEKNLPADEKKTSKPWWRSVLPERARKS